VQEPERGRTVVTAARIALVAAVVAGLQLARLPSSDAVSIGNGERIYSSICSRCHSQRVTNNVYGILRAGNDPDFIRRTFATKPPMEFIASILSATEIEDVAAYLGNHDGIDPDRIFDWAEWEYLTVFRPPGASSQVSIGYYFRHYPESNTYVGISRGRVYYYAPDMPAPIDVGAAAYFLEQAAADGF
jgi:mono/diheme cytochrome c family protein